MAKSDIEREIAEELTPRAPLKSRKALREELEHRRWAQEHDAAHFLYTGESIGVPPYGSEWNRDYNPRPYPEAVPDPDMYMGTSIGFLYGMHGSECHAWQIAGWNLVKTDAEVRRRASGPRVSEFEMMDPGKRKARRAKYENLLKE